MVNLTKRTGSHRTDRVTLTKWTYQGRHQTGFFLENRTVNGIGFNVRVPF